ncbi:MAG: homoserine kinase [Candidatus Gastranaerophilales bacterium]|nr:homoserine kinase [Candidatus Gastranaerophilales bacterium]
MKVSVETPATIANLGCGFDSFGLALPLYNIITVEETIMPGSGIEINILNNDSDNIPHDKNNIVFKAIELLYNYIGQAPTELKINIKTEIPVARGLGSSASVITGGLIAANELLGHPADEEVLLSIATEIEGHPDNITPAVTGGVTISALEDTGSITYRKLPWPLDWKIIVGIPDFELTTDISRSILPQNVPIQDAAFNLRRAAMFVEAVHTKDEELMKLALTDKLHQPYRMKLVPGLNSIMENLKHTEGVLGCVLAGAGPSIAVISNGKNMNEIKEIVQTTWNNININAKIHTWSVAQRGARIL